jgi:hypothetical protein
VTDFERLVAPRPSPPSTTADPGPQPLLERRLELVVRELRGRADAQTAVSGKVAEPLGRALADFESRLRAVRAGARRTR